MHLYKRYEWLEHRSRYGLIELVNEAIEFGYEPLGAPFVMKLYGMEPLNMGTNRMFVQVVVKK